MPDEPVPVITPEPIPPSSILNTIKKMLGLEIDYDAFDTDIIVNINSVLMGLTQIGVGPTTGFLITGADEVWSDLVGETTPISAVQTFIYLKVKILFDPPTSSSVLDALTRQASEFEWRLSVQVDPGEVATEEVVADDYPWFDA